MLPEALVLFPLALALLADTASPLPDPKSPETMGWLLMALAGLAVAANQVMGGVVNFRKLKRGDAEDAAGFVRREEHAELRGRVDAIERTLGSELRDIHRALGRIEGALGTAPGVSVHGNLDADT